MQANIRKIWTRPLPDTLIKAQSPKLSHKGQWLRYAVKKYYQEKRWDRLLQYLLFLDKKEILPHYWKWQIAMMYIYQGQYKKSLDFLYPLHFANPDLPDIQLMILETLYCMKKNANAFPWLKKPRLKRLGEAVITHCLGELSRNPYPMALCVLFYSIGLEDFTLADEFDLLYAIKTDHRFETWNTTCFFRFSRVRINTGQMTMAA